MTLIRQIITIAMCVLGTMFTRFFPFLVFREKRPTPAFVRYLGDALPLPLFAMLIVYCLKNVKLTGGTHGLPEAAAILLTAVLHRWKNNMLLSIAGGTVCYMALIRLF